MILYGVFCHNFTQTSDYVILGAATGTISVLIRLKVRGKCVTLI